MKYLGGIIIGVVVTILVIVGIAKGCGDPPPPPIYTVSQFENSFRNIMDSELSDPSHSIRKRIESAHATVDVNSAEVSYIKCLTFDGTNDAGGKEGRKIKNVRMRITTRWDGIFHKNGKTVLEVVLHRDSSNSEFTLQRGEIIESDAVVNIEDPEFWYKVGATAALFLI